MKFPISWLLSFVLKPLIHCKDVAFGREVYQNFNIDSLLCSYLLENGIGIEGTKVHKQVRDQRSLEGNKRWCSSVIREWK